MAIIEDLLYYLGTYHKTVIKCQQQEKVLVIIGEKIKKYQMLRQEVVKHPALKHLARQYQILLTKEWRNYYEIHLNYAETALFFTNLNAKDKNLAKRDIIFLQQKIAAMEANAAVGACLPKPMIPAKAVLSNSNRFKVSEINALALAQQPTAVQKINDKQMVAN